MNANTTIHSVQSRARGGLAATLARSSLALTILALAGCGGGGSGGGGPTPAAPQGLVAFAGDGEVTLTWTPTPEAESYAIYWDTQPGVTKQSGRRIAGVKAPYLHQGLPNLRELHYVVAAGSGGREGPVSAEVSATPRVTAGQFKPAWAGVQPARVLSVEHDPGRTDAANGQHLADRIAALAPGERLEVGAGHWVLPDFVSIDLQGSASAPIWIAARPGTRPVLTRANRNDAVLHVGAAGGARYLVLMGLELTGGDRGFDLWDAREVWIDLNLISRNGGTPVAADSANTQAVYITRNQLDHAGGDGHGIVLGAADGSSSSSGAVVAQNQVSHCRGVGATGIWVRQGSAGNWIVENVVHDTDWPCILVEGSGGGAWNTIERNLAYGSRDTVVEVQSQAHVLNNLVMDGLVGLVSRDGASTVRDLEVVHNTIVNARRAVSLEDWSGRPGLVFANNVAYSERAEGLRIVGGTNGFVLRGNVLSGIVQGVPVAGYTLGNGLTDFVDVTWSASRRDATPSPGGAIVDSADAAEHVPEDLTGRPRDMATLESGCLDVE